MKKKDLSDIEVTKETPMMFGGQSWCLFCGKKYISSKLIEKIGNTKKCPNCGKKLVPQR